MTRPTSLTVRGHLPDGYLADALRRDAALGLTAHPKWLPPKWFYDARGSRLFEDITRLPEYYPTRAEREILERHAVDIAATLSAHTLVELGSGSSEKTRLLLDALRGIGSLERYVPVDVSEPALVEAGEALLRDYPGLAVEAVVSDFDAHLGIPDGPGPTLVAFLGGTLGNLTPDQRAVFLASVRSQLRAGDGLVLGADLVKDPGVLVRAYDDAAGVTADFNRNVLRVLNRELDADFNVDRFDHVAVWDSQNAWIEMRLRSHGDQTVKLRDLDLVVEFADGEEMRTEISAKFRASGLAAEIERAGFAVTRWWTDSENRFGVALATPV
ncbi:L-histidine N(alpha)-methyltransferase [Yinghuangia seranimata]|uniref:L-histidine N(alpha)-methyltransferase n=1 Tax=Yinghuangia seranimata TaxID=408067 RepID=UPI00248C1F69|nr:L-histidine N(alpha)-methyltransferase [Yinghuangia seranimata]MDI2125879.1 L-histidine N(alpha)-methyltransferase [Yinghuangia seranimata]